MGPSFRILLVEPDLASAAVVEQTLVDAGHAVAPVSTFQEATRLLSRDYPDLLVTAVRLGAFNGLHLLLRCRTDHPDVPVIVIGALADLTPDVRRFGAQFVATPVDQSSFLDTVSRLLAGRTASGPKSARLWPRKSAEVPALVSDGSARIVELSYGGVRLELNGTPDGRQKRIDIRLPSLGLSVKVVPRWLKPTTDRGTWWCGAEVALPGSDAVQTWRGIVDSLL